MERSTITLVIDSSGKKTDLELPSQVPLEEMLELMMKGMNEWISLSFQLSDFRLLLSEGDESWRAIQPSMSLHELGVTDGCYLRLEKIQSFSTN
ncbi:EsaB/YukD family protein [Paenibacillus glacialis]|uniref:Ubiquitin-like domain-containing protein n=1 Tax=Paenibacillus glacialis TaxID=494026 RepID=A0A168HRC8_9BACL|nr:EsaB/YukD family protein [Paenibacillus glacialis]OAB38450.1 hypothetical protein PGLA_20375 [Paenibacillus glacialis]